MYRILVANPKGGCGKSTLATHIAGWFAAHEFKVMLGDVDRQQSSLRWLATRAETLPRIDAWEVGKDGVARPPKGTQAVVLDSPAGLRGKELKRALALVNRVIIPVHPSAFDLWASSDFFEQLAEEKSVRKHDISIGLAGMRVNARTQSAAQLVPFAEQHGLPLVTQIRETQLYVQAIQHGMTIFDLPAARTIRDREQWQPLMDWLMWRDLHNR